MHPDDEGHDRVPDHRRGGMPPRLRRAVAAVQRYRSPTPRVRGALLVVAAVGVVAAAAVAVRNLEVTWGTLTWWPLLVAAVVVTPLTVALNAAELRAMASATAPAPLSWPVATRTVVVATAANLLPLPGAALVRIQALRAVGATGAAATAVNLVGAGLWVGGACALAGAALLPSRPAVGAAGLALGAVAALAGAALLAPLRRTGWVGSLLRLAAVEAAITLVHAMRLYLVMIGIGVTVGIGQALVVGASAPLAAAAGVFPSGIGLAELLSALLAPLADVAPAAGLLATALGRVIGLAVIAPVGLAYGLRDLRRVRPTSSTADLDVE